MILDQAAEAIRRYNELGLHFNLVAEAIYRVRETIDPFSERYEPYIVAGLIAFDMERMMGEGDKYKVGEQSFRSRLRAKMRTVQGLLRAVPLACLHQIDLVACAGAIKDAYRCLAASGEGALHADSKRFDVGATKILHWIAPALFIIVDSNVAVAFSEHYGLFRKGTQPGYTPEKYLECLRHAKREIQAFGYGRLVQLEPATPLARLFDKAAYVAGLSQGES